MYLDEFKKKFEQLRHKFPRNLVACTKKQVLSLEKQVYLSLPEAYKEFLLWGGIEAGGFLEGSDYFYDNTLYKLRESAENLLKEEDFPFSLPKDAFVFNMHQGYIFWFFKTSEGNDPSVYGYTQGDPPVLYSPVPFKKNSPNFSEFLIQTLEEEAELI